MKSIRTDHRHIKQSSKPRTDLTNLKIGISLHANKRNKKHRENTHTNSALIQHKSIQIK